MAGFTWMYATPYFGNSCRKSASCAAGAPVCRRNLVEEGYTSLEVGAGDRIHYDRSLQIVPDPNCCGAFNTGSCPVGSSYQATGWCVQTEEPWCPTVTRTRTPTQTPTPTTTKTLTRTPSATRTPCSCSQLGFIYSSTTQRCEKTATCLYCGVCSGARMLEEELARSRQLQCGAGSCCQDWSCSSGTLEGTKCWIAATCTSASNSPTASKTVSFSSTSTPSQTGTGTPTKTGTSSKTPSITATSTVSATPTGSGTGSASKTGTGTSSPSQTPTSTQTQTPSNTPSNSGTGSGTGTGTGTRTGTDTGTGTSSQTPTSSITSGGSSSNTPSQSATPSQTSTSSITQTATQTITKTQTGSGTPTTSQTETPSQTQTGSTTVTQAQTQSGTGTQTQTSSQTPSETPTPSQTPSSSCPAWTSNKVRVCFEGTEQKTGSILNGYFQYNKPGTDTNDKDPKNAEYMFTSGDNGLYFIKDGSIIIQTIWDRPQVHVGVHMGVDDFVTSSINSNSMEPAEENIVVHSILFHANRIPESVETIFTSDELPLASVMTHPDLVSNAHIQYYNTATDEYTNDMFDIASVLDCSTYCPPMSFPSATPTPSPTPSTSCIPPLSNQQRHCITGTTDSGKKFTGYYKFDRNTPNNSGDSKYASYPHDPKGYGGLYLEDENGQAIQTDSNNMMFSIGVSIIEPNEMGVGSAFNIEVPDIKDKTITAIAMHYRKSTTDPTTNLKSLAIPTPLPMEHYDGDIEIHYVLDEDETTTYLWRWFIDTVSECNEGCPAESPTPTPSNSGTPSNTPSNSGTPTPSRSEGASYSNTPTPSVAPVIEWEQIGPVSDPIELIVRYTDAWFGECIDYIEAYYHKCNINKDDIDTEYWLQCGHAICDTVYNNGGHEVCFQECNDEISSYAVYLASPTEGMVGYNLLQSAFCYPVFQSSHNANLELSSGYWDADFSTCNADLDACYDDCKNTKIACDSTYSSCLLDACGTVYQSGDPKRVVCEVVMNENDADVTGSQGTTAFGVAQGDCVASCNMEPIGIHSYGTASEACEVDLKGVTQKYGVLKCITDILPDKDENNKIYTPDIKGDLIILNNEWILLYDDTNKIALQIDGDGYPIDKTDCNGGNIKLLV
jgi:hypothetical protein